MLAGTARSQNAGSTHGNPRPQRSHRGRLSGSAQESEGSFLPWTGESSATRAGPTPDERLWFDDYLRNGIAEEREQAAEKSAGVFSGRITGRSRNSNFAPGNYDARRAGREGSQGHRTHRRPGAHLGRN